MFKPRYLVAFSGHRSIQDVEGVRLSLGKELAHLKSLIAGRGGVMELYCSIAYGGDLLACEEAEKLDIPVHLILPKPVVINAKTGEVDNKTGFAEDFWDKGSHAEGSVFLEGKWEACYRWIQNAECGRNGSTLRIATGSQVDPECYYDANLQLLEAADAMLVVWDGQPSRGLGGTQQLMDLAQKRELPLIVIPALGGEPERLRLDELAVDDEGRKIIALVDRCSAAALGEPKSKPAMAAESEETAGHLFQRLQVCSSGGAAKFRSALVTIIKVNAVATLVGALAVILPQSPLGWKTVLAGLSALEFCLVGWIFWKNTQLKGKNSVHESWMQSRFAAELMRAMQDSAGLLDPLHPLVAPSRPAWRRFAITAGLMVTRSRPKLAWQEARTIYVRERLGLSLEGPNEQGQIAYFKTKGAEAEPRFRWLLKCSTILSKVTVVFVVGALIYKGIGILAKVTEQYFPADLTSSDRDWLSWLFDVSFKFLPIVLPLLTGLFTALRVALDSGRRSYRYPLLARRLMATAVTLESLKTESSVRRTVTDTEQMLLDELIEWHLTERQNRGK